MFSVAFNYLLLIYIGLGLTSILALWFFYDSKTGTQFKKERLLHVFHCVKCGKIYSIKGGKEKGECPNCNFSNVRLKF